MKTKKIVVLILTVLILGIFIMNLIYEPSSSDVYQVVSMINHDEADVIVDESFSLIVTKTGFKVFSKKFDGVMEFKYLEDGQEFISWSWLIDDNLFFGRKVEMTEEVEYGMVGKMIKPKYKVKYKDGVWPFNSDKLKVQLLIPNRGVKQEVKIEINCKKM